MIPAMGAVNLSAPAPCFAGAADPDAVASANSSGFPTWEAECEERTRLAKAREIDAVTRSEVARSIWSRFRERNAKESRQSIRLPFWEENVRGLANRFALGFGGRKRRSLGNGFALRFEHRM
jgi:hypothetical protein